ncbi:hypothetical protein Sste5346_000240 [Sporothrix stenoceras]|uniref:PIG-P domain-containing protein n=1 Tax=Sporothrix stenoceras TaxID=5173 RepID=A0ABR3ZU90_9PEZI
MAVTSEDEDKPASDAQSAAAEEYEGDEGESYRGEEEDDDDDEFDESFEFDEFDDDEDEDEEDGDEFDDEYDAADDIDGVGPDGAAAATATATGISGGGGGSGEGAFDDHDNSGAGSGGGGGSFRLLRRTRSAIRATSATGGPPPPPLQNHFAPPFYGRPPTPLPPSPSLTSLLRPSRPTTPDATDDELEPVPRAAPQVPTYEYYGFVLYLFSSLAFLIYLLWSYLPSPFLHALGIYYYPNRWWSLAIPSFLVMTFVYIYVALAAYNTEILTLPLDSIETIVDGAAKMAAVDEDGCVVIIGGPDGTHVQGRGVTASSASESSGNRPTSSRSQSRLQQQKPSQTQQQKPPLTQAQTHRRQNPSLHNADTIASWSASKPFTHQREPSSPSPPLGKTAWRDRSVKNSRDRKNKKSNAAGTTTSSGAGDDAENDNAAHAAEDSGLTMSGRVRGWGGGRPGSRGNASDGHDGSSYSNSTTHRTPSDWNRLWNMSTDAVMDIPLAGVCEVLYG